MSEEQMRDTEEQTQSAKEQLRTGKKQAKQKYPFWKRLLVFLLGMFVGFIACVGGIAGAGFWAYSNLSADKLGVTLPEPLQGTGEADISKYTLQMLVGDLMYYTNSANKDKLTLANLQQRYGLNFLNDVNGMLPEELTNLVLSELGSEDALNEILSCLDFNFVFSFLEEGAIPPAMADALGDRDISALAEGNFVELLEGVKLGYLLGLEYEKQGDEWVLVSEEEGIMPILAEIEVGPMIDVAMNGGDMLEFLRDGMGDATLAELMGGDDDANWLASVKMADIIVYSEENGAYMFDILSALGDVFLGEIMGYEKNADEWYDENNEKIVGINASLSNIELQEIMDGELDITEIIGDMQLGEVMGYELRFDTWYDGGEKVEGVNAAMADIKLCDVMNGDLDVTDAIGDLLIGEMMGYEKHGKVWYDGNGEQVTGVTASVADMPLSDVLEGTMDVNDVFGDMYLGEVMGYEVVSYKADGVTPKTWKDGNGNLVEGFDEDIANIKVGALTDGNGVDFQEVFGDQLVGELQGYEKRGNQWYDEYNRPLDALDNSIANIYVGDMIDGTVDLSETFRDAKVSELLGYRKLQNGTWVDENNQKVNAVLGLLADVKIGEMNDTVSSWKLGDIMGYENVGGVWKEADGTVVDGLNKNIADIDVNDFTDGDGLDISDILGDETVGELQGYEKRGDQWYDEANQPLDTLENAIADLKVNDLIEGTADLSSIFEDAKVADLLGYTQRPDGTWQDENGQDVSRVIELLAEATVGEMNDTVSSWSLGDIMGYKYVGGVWVNPNGETNSMMAQVATLGINDLSDPDAVHAAVDGMKMCDILGYEKRADGNWYHGSSKVTGVMAYLADHKVSELAYEVDHMEVHDILGYKKVGSEWVHEDGSELCPLMAAIADATINELDQTVSNLTLDQIFENTNDGFFSLLGGTTKISELDARIDEIFDSSNGVTIGEFMDAGLVDDVTPAQSAKLSEYIGSDWRDLTVTGFINSIIDIIAGLPSLG